MDVTGMRVLYAHGFEGSPEGSKPSYMTDELGWELTSPVMSELGWNIEQETEVLLRILNEDGPFELLVGSSMGALAIANASALRPDLDMNLLLLAPAFGLSDLWRTGAGRVKLAILRLFGSAPYYHRGLDEKIRLPWDFIEAADKMSWPKLAHPTVILHGLQDDIVPIENSRRVASESEHVVELIEIEDGHRMQQAGTRFTEAANLLGLMPE